MILTEELLQQHALVANVPVPEFCRECGSALKVIMKKHHQSEEFNPQTEKLKSGIYGFLVRICRRRNWFGGHHDLVCANFALDSEGRTQLSGMTYVEPVSDL